MQFFQPLQRGLAFFQGRLHLRHFGLGSGGHRPAALGLLVELAGIEPGQRLALDHLVIGIDEDFLDGSGQFAAHSNLVGRLQVASGIDRQPDGTENERLGHIGRLLAAAGGELPARHAENDEDRHGCDDVEPPAPGCAFFRLQDFRKFRITHKGCHPPPSDL